MRKSDIGSVTVYDIEIYCQRILTAQIEGVQYKKNLVLVSMMSLFS